MHGVHRSQTDQEKLKAKQLELKTLQIAKYILGLLALVLTWIVFFRLFPLASDNATDPRATVIGMPILALIIKAGNSLWTRRQKRVRLALKEAWGAYRSDCYGADEYAPIARTGKNATKDGSAGFYIANNLDTLILMDLPKEREEARNWIKNLSFNINEPLNTFKVCSQTLGGLLSAYHLTKEQFYLDKAVGLSERLFGAFQTPSGLPSRYINLDSKSGSDDKSRLVPTAEATACLLEFSYMAFVTGDKKYWEYVKRASSNFQNAKGFATQYISYLPLLTNFSVGSGRFLDATMYVNSGVDSYYEYLLKQFLLTAQSQPQFFEQYRAAIKQIQQHLIYRTLPTGIVFLSTKEVNGSLTAEMDHSSCLLGGTLALGATAGERLGDKRKLWSMQDTRDFRLGELLARTCTRMYDSSPAELSPEKVNFMQTEWLDPKNLDNDNVFKSEKNKGQITQFSDHKNFHVALRRRSEMDFPQMLFPKEGRHNKLAPETAETLFVLWRLTGDEKYRKRGWRIFRAMQQNCKLKSGAYAGVKDVASLPVEWDDHMDSIFLVFLLY